MVREITMPGEEGGKRTIQEILSDPNGARNAEEERRLEDHREGRTKQTQRTIQEIIKDPDGAQSPEEERRLEEYYTKLAENQFDEPSKPKKKRTIQEILKDGARSVEEERRLEEYYTKGGRHAKPTEPTKTAKPTKTAENKSVVVDREIYQPDIKSWKSIHTPKNSVFKGTARSTVKDYLRVLTGKFWYGTEFTNKDQGIYFYENRFTRKDDFIFQRPKLLFNPQIVDYTQQKYQFGLYRQVLKHDQNVIKKMPATERTRFFSELANIELRNQTTAYSDHAFVANYPFQSGDLDSISGKSRPLFYDCTSEYNIFIRKYEEGIDSPEVPEQILPNIHALYFQNHSIFNPDPNVQIPEIYKNLITLDGLIPTDKLHFKGAQSYWKRFGTIKNVPAYDYFLKYGENVNSFMYGSAYNTTKQQLAKKFTNVGFQPEDIEMLNLSSEYRDVFPMYVDVGFNTEIETPFADFLKTSGLFDFVLAQAIPKPATGDAKDKKQIYYVDRDKTSPDFNLLNTNTLDIMLIYQRMRNAAKSGMLNDLLKLGEDSDAIIMFLEKLLNPINIFQVFRVMNLQAKLLELTKKHMRSFQEMMEGKPCYSEVIMYRIEKTDENDKLIQNFYIPNSSDLDIVKFIDTQVKYAKKYKYKVHAQYFVIGTKYWYKRPPGNVFLEAHYVPSPQVIEVPYFTREIEVLDSPPIPPDVDILPYVNKDDRILFNFNRRVDDIIVEPIPIQQKDEEVFERIRNSQGLTTIGVDTKINFKSDSNEPIKAFEIYRINKKPTSYEDFRNKLMERVETLCITNSASFLDRTVKSNRKYYYMFRTVDIHDHFSNPSPVYEVELINDSGYIYLRMRVIEFEQKIKKQLSRPGRKYIYIKPSILQTEIDPEQFKKSSASSNPNSFVLGETEFIGDLEKAAKEEAKKSGSSVETNLSSQIVSSARDLKNVILGDLPEDGEQIWDKKFKLRIKSKKTGRVIDLNFTFKHFHDLFKKELQRKDLC